MSEFERTVFIDMDGTMVDFDGAALKNIPVQHRVQRGNFYLTDDYPVEFHPAIKEVYNHPDFFENLELLPGVKEAWQALLDNGYHPRVLSAPLSSNPMSVQGKIANLERLMVPDFGRSVVDEAIFDKEKWKYDGIALIDDRPNVSRGPDEKYSATWEHILFGWENVETVPQSTAAFRLFNWEDPDALLNMLHIIQFKNK